MMSLLPFRTVARIAACHGFYNLLECRYRQTPSNQDLGCLSFSASAAASRISSMVAKGCKSKATSSWLALWKASHIPCSQFLAAMACRRTSMSCFIGLHLFRSAGALAAHAARRLPNDRQVQWRPPAPGDFLSLRLHLLFAY